MLFTLMVLSKSSKFLIASVFLILIFVWVQVSSLERKKDFDDVVKIALRDVGHQLLLSSNDSTTIVSPIQGIGEDRFVLSFASPISFFPGDLVSISQKSIEKRQLPDTYRISVVECDSIEVIYSVDIDISTDASVIQCGTRPLPEKCYNVHYQFLEPYESYFTPSVILILLIFVGIFLSFYEWLKKNDSKKDKGGKQASMEIGVYKFYPKQNKLIQKEIEINLSKKECEILMIFASQPNEIITREELMKRVWEDNGVVVGRSLDTYISKLRKKIKEDTNVQLVNIHGVGYRLEIKN